MMRISQRGIDLITQFEGFKPNAYFCLAGVATIGFGHTKTVTKSDVAKRRTISKAQAYDLLREDLADSERAVSAVKLPQGMKLTQCQFDALVSLVFNCGPAPLKGGVGSALRQGKLDLIPSQFMKWTKVRDPKTKQLVTSKGLLRRRNAEVALWRAVDTKAAFPVSASKTPVITPAEVEEDNETLDGVSVEALPEKSLTESGTVKGAVIAGIGGISVATQTAQPIIEQVQQARSTWDAVTDLGFSPLVIGLIIMAVGIGYVVYRRYRDRHFL